MWDVCNRIRTELRMNSVGRASMTIFLEGKRSNLKGVACVSHSISVLSEYLLSKLLLSLCTTEGCGELAPSQARKTRPLTWYFLRFNVHS
jgi:hypothetical protein